MSETNLFQLKLGKKDEGATQNYFCGYYGTFRDFLRGSLAKGVQKQNVFRIEVNTFFGVNNLINA